MWEALVPARKLKHFSESDEGQALVLTALALVVLMLMAGLGVDVGYLRYQKQQMQKAADAAALAGASNLIYAGFGSGTITTAARSDAQANGYTHGINGITVTVNNPPQSQGDSFVGDNNYVEVIVAQVQPTFFMKVVGSWSTVLVSSRAVASSVGSPSGCVWVLDPTDSGSLLVDGNVNINSACGIYVDSNSASGILKHGGSGTVRASAIGVRGGYSGVGFYPTPATGIAPFNDPLASVAQPTPAPGCANPNPPGGKYTPGTYCTGISISGSGSYTFAPGLYTLRGGLTVAGSPTLSGTGVTFFNSFDGAHPYGGISLHGASGTTFSAPTDSSNGGVPGVLFFQDRRVPIGSASSDFAGNNGEVYKGALYFPTTGISYKGIPLLNEYTIMVAYTMEFKGDTTIKEYAFPDGSGPIRNATLVE